MLSTFRSGESSPLRIAVIPTNPASVAVESFKASRKKLTAFASGGKPFEG